MTPRHAFVPTGLRHRAYEDAPLPIGSGQTISQPLVHARYLELLELTGKERVLEIGTGSGYQTVLLAHLVAQVFSIERIPALMQHGARGDPARRVSERLAAARRRHRRLARVRAVRRDSRRRRRAVGAAAAASSSSPRADGCSIPVGDRAEQKLVVAQRKGDQIETQEVAPVRFVPLVGSHGWSAGDGQ